MTLCGAILLIDLAFKLTIGLLVLWELVLLTQIGLNIVTERRRATKSIRKELTSRAPVAAFFYFPNQNCREIVNKKTRQHN